MAPSSSDGQMKNAQVLPLVPSPAQDYLIEEVWQETRYETALGTRNVASCRHRDADGG